MDLKQPRILVTAGGTRELIDDVRMITNRSTGKLGSLIADVFTARGALVTYLYANHAIQPNFEPYRKIQIKTTAQLLDTFNKLLEEEKYDAICHLMAVSDFSPFGYCETGKLEDNSTNLLNSQITPLNESKISSKLNGFALFFKNSPKVINVIRTLQPNTILVGFKLLSNSNDIKLLSAAKYVLESAKCDFVVANDQSNISLSKNKHEAFIIDKSGNREDMHSKEEIAIKVAQMVCDEIKNRKLV